PRRKAKGTGARCPGCDYIERNGGRNRRRIFLTPPDPSRKGVEFQLSEDKTLKGLLTEDRLFPPAEEFVAQANVRDNSLYEWAERDRLGFWAGMADRFVHWFRKWDEVLDWSNPPFAKWFVGGKLNASYNCIDKHLGTWRKTKAAIIWEGEPGDSRVLTYQDLYREVTKFAHVLRSLGVGKGDRVTLYLGMVPELAIAMLACAR